MPRLKLEVKFPQPQDGWVEVESAPEEQILKERFSGATSLSYEAKLPRYSAYISIYSAVPPPVY